MHNQRASKKRIDTLVHSCLRLFARAQAPCVIVSSSNTTRILDSVSTRIGFVKRSYKGGRMYTPLWIIKQCLPTITLLNSLLLHHKTTYITLTVNVHIFFFFFFFLRLFSFTIISWNWPSTEQLLFLSFFLADDDERWKRRKKRSG
jgi:hypothetical protein